MAKPKQISPEKLRRKWLKFVAVHEQYEKCVKVCREMRDYEYYECFYRRDVIEENLLFRKPFIFVNGFFRVRTDREHYPACGITGIPDERRSKLSEQFWKHRRDGHDQWQKIKFLKQMASDEKAYKEKKAEDRRLCRNIPNWELAYKMGIKVADATPAMLEATRNHHVILRTIKEIKKLTK